MGYGSTPSILGIIDTAIWTKPLASTGTNAPIDPNEVAKTRVPFGRAGHAQDIANGVLFSPLTHPATLPERNW
jgi:hypothetical protein